MAKNDVIAWIKERLSAQVVIAFALGVVLGLVVLGWWLWPVQWSNSNPADLKSAYKDAYMQMIADSYALTGNAEVARARLNELKSAGEKDAEQAAALDRLSRTRITAGDANAAMRLQALSSALSLPLVTTPKPTSPATTQPASNKGTPWLRIAGIAFFLLLLVSGVIFLFVQLRNQDAQRRRRPPTDRQPYPEAPETETEKGTTATPPAAADNCLGHFDTQYNLGDESYDVSYSIESPTGEFLGECGVSALETPGVGRPDGITAFEVWLFDKDDVRTETKALLSERAFTDPILRDKLTNKSELSKAEPDQVVMLETANLRLTARVVTLAYESTSNGAVFAKLATHLEVSQR